MIEAPLNQIFIFFTKFNKELPDFMWDYYFNLLPDDQRERNSRFVRWQDRYSHLFGRLLLIEGLKLFEYEREELSNMFYNKFNRPYLNESIDFNISHSGEYVLCAIGKGFRIGIDIEEIKDIDFYDFRAVMSDDQWGEIYQSANPHKTFFKYWTIKESVIKADSRGLSIPLLDIYVNNNAVCYDDQKWYLNELNLNDDYCVCLACNKPNTTNNFFKIDYCENELSYCETIS